jgi:calcium-dependent protein kinase
VINQDTQLGIAASLMTFRKATLLQSGVISFLTNLLATNEDLQDYVDMFEMMDTSKDGYLSIDEIKVGVLGPMGSFYFKRTDWDEVLLSMDTDGDGRIDFTEFITAAYDKKKLLCKDNLKIAFKMFDIDGNGSITKDELK